MKKETYKFGIACTDRQRLKERVTITGLRIATPSESYGKGFGNREVIMPTDERREATDEEIERIVAKPDTPHVAKIVKVAVGVGYRARAIAMADPNFKLDMTGEPVDFGHGIEGFPGGADRYHQGMPNVTRDEKGLLVGDHIVTRPEPDMRAAIVNLGPGAQDVRTTPSPWIDAASFNGEVPGQTARLARMRELIADGRVKELVSYSFRIDPPKYDAESNHMMTEAFTGLAPTQYLYDGSTGFEASSAAFVVSPPQQDPWANYASVV